MTPITTRILRHINVGDVLRLRTNTGDRMDIGARRKRTARTTIVDANGTTWDATCIQWHPEALWQVTGMRLPAIPITKTTTP